LRRTSLSVVAAVLLSACGGGGTMPGTDGRRVHPPEDLGCADDARWTLELIDAGARGSGSRLFIDRSGRVSILQPSPFGGGDLALYQKASGDDHFTRVDTPSDITTGLTRIVAASADDAGQIFVLLLGVDGMDRPIHRTASWDGAWSVGETVQERDVPEYAGLEHYDFDRLCTMAANGIHRTAEYFTMRRLLPDDRPLRLVRSSGTSLDDLGPLPHPFMGCSSFEERGVAHFALPAPPDLLGLDGASVQEFTQGGSSWLEVGRYGTSLDAAALPWDTFYESAQGLRVVISAERASPRWTGHTDAVLSDMALDGLDQSSGIDHIFYEPYLGLGEGSYASVDQVRAVTDEGAFTHVVYRRAGCENCDDSPGLAGGFGLRYAVRTDAGWVRKDAVWHAGEPMNPEELQIIDLLAWHGDVHVLLFLDGGSFSLGQGSLESDRAGLYELRGTGCAAR